jgi:RNA polymerase sigma factor FliA
MNSHQQPAGPLAGELEELLSSAEGLVEQLAAQLAQECASGLPREDLLAYGKQGLLEAALRFDASRGAQFRTFAYYRVRGAMIDGLRKMGPWSRRGFERVAMLRGANAASEDLAEHEGATASLTGQQAAERLRKHMASVVTAMTTGVFASARWQSSSVEPGDGGAGRQLVAIDEASNAEEQLAESELKRLVQTAVNDLPPPEDEVVRRFYLEGHNMDLIAQDLGRSRSWVSRVHTRALSRMGARLRREALSL